MKTAINFVSFQLCWFACALGAAKGLGWAGPLAVALALGLHFSKVSEQPKIEAIFIAKAALLGLVVDSILSLLGSVNFGELAPLGWVSPPYMIALWAIFASTINHSMSWMRGRMVLAVVMGLVFGPVAYHGGAALGAFEIAADPLMGTGAVAVLWGASMAALLMLNSGLNEAPE